MEIVFLVWHCVIDRTWHGYLPTWPQIVYETRFSVVIPVFYRYLTVALTLRCDKLKSLSLVKLANCSLAVAKLFLTREENNPNVQVHVCIAKSHSASILLLENGASVWSMHFTLEHFRVNIQVTLAWSVPFISYREDISTKAQTSWGYVRHILALDTEPSPHIRLRHRLGPYNQGASGASLSSVLNQVLWDRLGLWTHDSSHLGLIVANHIWTAFAIIINHLKLELLGLFEEKLCRDFGREIRVQTVINLFSLANLSPLIGFFIKFKNAALGIRLRKDIQIRELAARNVELHSLR